MLYFNRFDDGSKEQIQNVKLPINVDSFHVSYNGGRLEVSVNGLVVLRTGEAGGDFGFHLDRMEKRGD